MSASSSTGPTLPPIGGRPALSLSMEKKLEVAPAGPAFPTLKWTIFAVFALTALGGFLRFWRLGQQSYWCDEAATAERICDSFDHLLQALYTQGFPPGWYVVLQKWLHLMQWWTGSEGEAFKPEYLRALPAFFGTLTVPAMYLLARQFTDRRGALLVMLLAAVNPFLIYYSRDIKMYAAFYFFVTLHTGLFFAWLAAERWYWKYLLLWPLVAVTGMAMLALQQMGWFLVGLELIWLLTSRNLKAMMGPLWALSVAMMAALPLWWQLSKSNFLDRAINLAEGTPGKRGEDLMLGWITRYTDMSWHTLISLPTIHIFGFLWPEEGATARMKDWLGLGTTYTTMWWLDRAEWFAGVALLLILVAGLLPWRTFDWSKSTAWKRLTKGHWLWKAALALPVAQALVVWRTSGVTRAWAIAVLIGLLMLPGFYWIGFRKRPPSMPKATRGRAWWIALWIAVPIAALAFTWLDDHEAIEIRAVFATYPLPPAPMEVAHTVTGTLTKFVGNQITLHNDSGDLTVTITDDTTFNINGRNSQSSTLRAGMKAIITTPQPWRIPLLNLPVRHSGIWGSFQLPRVWEPRYLGIILPALLLWLGAALRRMPTWPVRTAVIIGVVGVCTASALTNHLVFRTAPYQQTAELVAKYIDKSHKDTLAYGTPMMEFAANSAQYPFILELGGKILPQANANAPSFLAEYREIVPNLVDDQLVDSDADLNRPVQGIRFRPLRTYRSFLLIATTRSQTQTIVLTDRLAGTPDDPLSNEKLAGLFDGKWELKEEQWNPYYYEWRGYVYHVWRTRVWVRKPAVKAG